MLQALIDDLQEAANPERAAFATRYFKTGSGQYAEGDIFLGMSAPALRNILKKYPKLYPQDSQELLDSPIHEHRMAALLIWVNEYKKASILRRREIVEQYLANINRINNWDLVDCSAPSIIGAFLFDKNRELLDELAGIPHLWSQRVAIVSTLYFIRKQQFSDTLRLCETLFSHTHDLIHKACGWMLREVGKKDVEVLKEFLNDHTPRMPRTTLRYAIERLEPRERQYYMQLR